MVEARWRLRWLGPGVLTIGTIGVIGSAVAVAQDRFWEPPPCEGGGAARLAGARAVSPPTFDRLASAPQARLEPRLDADGSLIGQRLTVGSARRRDVTRSRTAARVVRRRSLRAPPAGRRR